MVVTHFFILFLVQSTECRSIFYHSIYEKKMLERFQMENATIYKREVEVEYKLLTTNKLLVNSHLCLECITDNHNIF